MNVDHATIHRWSIKLWSPINQLAKVCHCIARKTLGWALLAFYTRYLHDTFLVKTTAILIAKFNSNNSISWPLQSVKI